MADKPDPPGWAYCAAFVVILLLVGWIWSSAIDGGAASDRAGALVACQLRAEQLGSGLAVAHQNAGLAAVEETAEGYWLIRSHFDVGVERVTYTCETAQQSDGDFVVTEFFTGT